MHETILCEILCPPCFNLVLLVDNLSNTIIITYLHFDKHLILGSRVVSRGQTAFFLLYWVGKKGSGTVHGPHSFLTPRNVLIP